MAREKEDTMKKKAVAGTQNFRSAGTKKGKIVKVVVIILFLIILVAVIRVVRYTKHNLPPSTALLPVPAETLKQAVEGESGQVRK